MKLRSKIHQQAAGYKAALAVKTEILDDISRRLIRPNRPHPNAQYVQGWEDAMKYIREGLEPHRATQVARQSRYVHRVDGFGNELRP